MYRRKGDIVMKWITREPVKVDRVACPWLLIGTCVFMALTLALSACDQGGSPAGSAKTPVASATKQGIQLGQQPCPASVKAVDHWNAVVDTGPTKTVEGAICGYLMGVPSLQVVVHHRGS